MIDIEQSNYWPREWPDWPQDPKARKAVAGSLQLGLIIMNAPVFFRKSRLAKADERAQDFLSQMSETEQEKAKALAARWEQNALIEQSIRYFEVSQGIEAARPFVADWECAEFQMNKIEEEAAQLGLVVYEYLRNREEQFRILEKDKDEVGQFHNLPDYSELQEQWYAHKPITAPLPWPWEEMLNLCKRFEANGHPNKDRTAASNLPIVGIVVEAARVIVDVARDKLGL